jgi:hypothetical protein
LKLFMPDSDLNGIISDGIWLVSVGALLLLVAFAGLIISFTDLIIQIALGSGVFFVFLGSIIFVIFNARLKNCKGKK